jgi:hypothetical protein
MEEGSVAQGAAKSTHEPVEGEELAMLALWRKKEGNLRLASK